VNAVADRAAHAAHLVRRFAGSLSRTAPEPGDEAWAVGVLRRGEAEVWKSLTNVDRRHALEVAHRYQSLRGYDLSSAELSAALLHDCGKLASGLTTLERVGATVWIGLTGRHRAGRGDGRIARYARHEAIGADLLAAAGSDPETVALVAGSADAPSLALAALHAADDV
jgi:hypothetical protein